MEDVSPPTGNQPVFTANRSSNTAKKNDGIAIPILVKTVKILSVLDFHLNAANTPKGTPTIHVIKITTTARRSVFGILSFNFVLTCSPFEVIPKSPFTKDFAHLPYCTIIGLSNPKRSVSFWRVSLDTEGFNLNSAKGSTGDNLIIKKLISETIINKGIDCKIRFRI